MVIKMTVFAALLGLSVMAMPAHAADKQWKKEHPRRAEVNKRLNNQNRRIKEGVKSGKLTKDQAKDLHKQDRAIRKEERAMAAQHGGHITKAEKKALNQQENGVSKEIHEEKHEQAPVAPAALPQQ